MRGRATLETCLSCLSLQSAVPQPSSPDVSARPPPWDPLLITRRKIPIIDGASLWRRLHGSVSCFFFGRSLPESMLIYLFSLPKSDNQRCRRRLLSCVSTGFKDQASIFRSWLLPGKPTSLLYPFLQSDQLSLIVSTCSSLFLHPVQKPAIWITSLFLILQPLVWFLTRPCLIPYQTQFFWLMVVAPDGSTSSTSRRAESGCHIINESSLYRSVYEKIYTSLHPHI